MKRDKFFSITNRSFHRDKVEISPWRSQPLVMVSAVFESDAIDLADIKEMVAILKLSGCPDAKLIQTPSNYFIRGSVVWDN